MKKLIIFILLASFLIGFNAVSALSNESINAGEKLSAAEKCIEDMANAQIPTVRANESYQSAKQIYDGQIVIEQERKVKGDYNSVAKYSEEVCAIREEAFRAHDQLVLLMKEYDSSSERVNLSSMVSFMEKINDSYYGQRFEDVPGLIDEGYTQLSELESSQTTIRLFYDSTTKGIQTFILENWKKISLVIIVMVVLLFIFGKTLKQYSVRRKIKGLEMHKETLATLIKNLQHDYFKSKTLSEVEFTVKLEKFKELIRDIDRQIPLLREEIVKLDSNNLWNRWRKVRG